jgi:hypothetical protein
MTGPTSGPGPFDGLFQAGLFPALPFDPFSEPSPIPSSAPTKATSGSIAVIDDVDDDNDVVLDGDDGAAAIGSGSPRTI